MLAKFFEADWSRTQRGGFVTVSDERQAVRMPKDQAAAISATDGSAAANRNRRVVQKSPEANETGEPVLTTGPRKRLGKSLKDINPTGVTKPLAAKGSAAPAPKS